MSAKRAAGPYSYDDDDDYVPSKAVKYSSVDSAPGPAKTKVHTLDSDEEELTEDPADCAGSENAFDVLKEDDIEGQEEQTVVFEGETTITPFNMKEEMEEGHFDGDGYYHFKKDSEVIKDAWLDDIDWIKVKQSETKYGSDEDDSSDAETGEQQQDVLEVYRSMLELLRPGETVTKAIKRLGGGRKLTSAQKWKLKKQQRGGGGESGAGSGDDMQQLLCLTDFANTIVGTGNMDVYSETYEMITVKLRPKDSAPGVDMFSDTPVPDSNSNEEDKSSVEAVRWQLRWENKDAAEVHGPFPSTQMLKWQNTGYLEKGAYVRKIADKESSWYHTNRIDFELYI